jgi:GH24 family phage-related lysozyme (muramidase)
MEFRESLIAQLKRHEGLSLVMYYDSLKVPTIGYGHNLKEPISLDAATVILHDDINGAINELDRHKPWWRELPVEAQIVVANMCFNMGWPVFQGFVRFWAALEDRAYNLAAIEMRDSLWYVQVKSRGEELVALMQSAQQPIVD